MAHIPYGLAMAAFNRLLDESNVAKLPVLYSGTPFREDDLFTQYHFDSYFQMHLYRFFEAYRQVHDQCSTEEIWYESVEYPTKKGWDEPYWGGEVDFFIDKFEHWTNLYKRQEVIE